MNINSEYIQKKEFHTAFKGYSMEEVDKFLDILAVEFERISKKNKELQDSIDKVRYEGEIKEETDVNTLVSEVLVSAHKVADEIKKKAEADAKEIIQIQKDIEDNQLKNLLKEKKELEEKVKSTKSFYGNFITKIKKDINEFNLKLTDAEEGVKIEAVSEDLTADTEDIKETEKELEKSSLPEEIEENELTQNNEDSGFYLKEEETEKNSSPDEIVRLSNEEEEKKIREVIDSKDIEENGDSSVMKDIKKEKKIFNEYEEDIVIKERKRIDIGNPDIINEFFGNSDERKY